MPAIDTICLVHHSHTDLGYTHDPVTVWEMHRRFVDGAVDAAERDLDRDAATNPDAFKWTFENTAPLLHWLEHAGDRQVERLKALERAGRLEVTGMFLNLTPLASPAVYAESLRPLERLRRDYGLTIRHAMTDDVNGHNWTLTDALLDHGIEATAVSSNDYCGGHPPGRPNIFRWQTPSKRELLTLNAWHYHTGNYAGIGPGPTEQFHRDWPILRAKLDAADWPFPFCLLQVTHQFGDNGTADFELCDFVRRWNAERRGDEPELRFATPAEFWDKVRAAGTGGLETRRGEWSDYWNFGSGSSARATALSRENEARLLVGDALFALLGPLGLHDAQPDGIPGRPPGPLLSRLADFRRRGWHNLAVWDEHTWDADSSQHSPEGDDTYAQWYQKANLAYETRSLSTMYQRDGAAELSLMVPREPGDSLLLYNPLPWPRTVAGTIDRVIYDPRPTGTDPSSARHHQDRTLAKFIKGKMDLLPTPLPACGYAVVKGDRLATSGDDHVGKKKGWDSGGEGGGGEGGTAATRVTLEPIPRDAATVENAFFKLIFDRERGGVASWLDKRTGRELVDAAAGWRFATPAHEAVDGERNPTSAFYAGGQWSDIPDKRGWQHDWPAKRGGVVRVISHEANRRPIGLEVTQTLEVAGLAGPATVRVLLPDHEPTATFEGSWMMTSESRPEATYFLLPFDVPGATARFDCGAQPIRVDADQLKGTNRDFFTVQRWVDFSNDDFGVTVACPVNPLVQLGDFNFAKDQSDGRPGRAMFLGWVTNNYWPTNFRPCQPGRVSARYVARPHDGRFDESLAHRHGAEAAMPFVAQSTFEPPRPGASLPRTATLLSLPGAPLVVTQVMPQWASVDGQLGDAPNEIVLTIHNGSDESAEATVGGGGDLLGVASASRLDGRGHSVSLDGGSLRLRVLPRRSVTFGLTLRRR